MAKLYGLGAAVVIAGALFKLQHWPGAGIMLTVGMSVEAFIFVCSAFEPLPHPDPHWELIYPELKAGFPVGYFKDEEGLHAVHGAPVRGAAAAGSGIPASVALAANAVDLSGVDTSKLASGLNRLSETADKLNELSSTVAAASSLSEKMQQASASVANFSQSYENSSQVLSESVHVLADSYQESAKTITGASRQVGEDLGKTGKQMIEVVGHATKSITDSGKQVGEELSKTGKQMADVVAHAATNFGSTFALIDNQIKANLDNLKHSGSGYTKQVELLNKNMTALNSAYELQVQEAGKYQKNNAQMGTQLEKLVQDLQRSAEENQAFRKGIAQLNSNLAELNSIYGSMLSAAQSVARKKS